MDPRIAAYRERLQNYYQIWVAWMLSGDREHLYSLNEMEIRSPRFDPLVLPPVVWIYRPPDQESDDYKAYDFLYRRPVTVGNHKFHRSGRNTVNRSTRHGRINWHATAKAIRAAQRLHSIRQKVFSNAVREVQVEIGIWALAQIPGWEFNEDGAFKIIWFEGDYLIYFESLGGVGAHTPATSTQPDAYVIMRVMRQTGGEDYLTRRRLAQEQLAVTAPDRLKTLLKEILRLRNRRAQAIVDKVTSTPAS